MRKHLARCAACRERAAAIDPSLLFLDLRSQPLPERFWDGFQERLRARLPEAGFDWTALFRPPRLAYLTAPLAMMLILGASLLVLRPGLIGPRRVGPRDLIRSPYDHAAGAVGPDRSGSLRPEAPPAAGDRGLGAVEGANPPPLEEVGSPSARVYHFSVGESGSETPIYLVVDESIDI